MDDQAKTNAQLREELQALRQQLAQVEQASARQAGVVENGGCDDVLQRQEDLLESIYTGTDAAIFVVDVTPERNFRYAGLNPAHERLSGLKSEEVQGKTPEELVPAIPSEAAAAVRANYTRCLEAGATVEYEEMIPMQGREMWWLTKLTPLHDDAGRLYRIIGSSTCINRLKAVEQELKTYQEHLEELVQTRTAQLQASEAKYRRIYETADDIIYTLDLNGNFTSLNHAEVLGYRREDVLGMNMADLLDEANLRLAQEKMAAKLSGAETITPYELEIVAKNGDRAWVSMTTQVVYEHGQPHEIFGIARDITARKHAEQALQESHQKYQALFENMSDGFAYHKIVLDKAGQPCDYIFLDVNEAFETYTGLRRTDILGHSAMAVIPDIKTQEPDVIRRCGRVALTGEKTAFELYAPPLQRWYAVSVFSPFRGYFCTTFTDISERKQAEAERERLNAELAQKNRELEQIVYVTSHDLRSPLVNVQGFSQELQYALQDLNDLVQCDDVPPPIRAQATALIEEEIGEDVKYILTSIAKMDTLLSALLRLSRLGRAALTITALDMNAMLAKIAADFEFQLHHQDVRLELGDVPMCRGDETQINQVFSNLIANALKYSDAARPGRIVVSGRIDHNQAVYCVADNGIGIAPQHQRHIFELFHRLNPQATPGEGMGLTIVRRILERHGGAIRVESEPGAGSRFYVTLPAVELG